MKPVVKVKTIPRPENEKNVAQINQNKKNHKLSRGKKPLPASIKVIRKPKK